MALEGWHAVVGHTQGGGAQVDDVLGRWSLVVPAKSWQAESISSSDGELNTMLHVSSSGNSHYENFVSVDFGCSIYTHSNLVIYILPECK